MVNMDHFLSHLSKDDTYEVALLLGAIKEIQYSGQVLKGKLHITYSKSCHTQLLLLTTKGSRRDHDCFT